ncbi:MAG: hypothetical protein WA056_10925 [Gallionella sp.]
MTHYAPPVALMTTLLAGMFAGWMLLSPFIIDIPFTLFKRLRRGEKLSQAYQSRPKVTHA